VAAISLSRGRKTWPLFSLWDSSKVTAACTRQSLSAEKPRLMAMVRDGEKSTPHTSPLRR
jgi:hypothetical protein